jgi:anaerobic ribonucleoside-triphosphate reductase
MVADAYANRAVPGAYTSQTLEEVNRQLEQDAKHIESIGDTRSGDAANRVRQIESVVSKINMDVSRQERAAVNELSMQLIGQERALGSLVESAASAH